MTDYTQKSEREKLRDSLCCTFHGFGPYSDHCIKCGPIMAQLALLDALGTLDARLQEATAREAAMYEGMKDEREALIRENRSLLERAQDGDRWREHIGTPEFRLVRERDQARDEAKRLREALVMIEAMPEHPPGCGYIALKALASEEEGKS